MPKFCHVGNSTYLTCLSAVEWWKVPNIKNWSCLFVALPVIGPNRTKIRNEPASRDFRVSTSPI